MSDDIDRLESFASSWLSHNVIFEDNGGVHLSIEIELKQSLWVTVFQHWMDEVSITKIGNKNISLKWSQCAAGQLCPYYGLHRDFLINGTHRFHPHNLRPADRKQWLSTDLLRLIKRGRRFTTCQLYLAFSSLLSNSKVLLAKKKLTFEHVGRI